VSSEELECRDGIVFVKSNPEITKSFAEVARTYFVNNGQLIGRGSYKPPKLGGVHKGSAVGTSPAYSAATQGAEVAIDEETGEIEVYQNFVLVMTWPSGRAAGLLVFKPKSELLVEIDIITLQEELRGLGLARYMYSFFESACKDGTLLFIVSVTEQGWQFYSRCGYQQDIDTFKILTEKNRVIPYEFFMVPTNSELN